MSLRESLACPRRRRLLLSKFCISHSVIVRGVYSARNIIPLADFSRAVEAGLYDSAAGRVVSHSDLAAEQGWLAVEAVAEEVRAGYSRKQ